MNERRMISPSFVYDALACLRRRGINEVPLLARASLPPVVLQPVSADQYGALWLAIAQAIDDEYFGEGARPMRSGSFTLLCHAILSAATLEQALLRALRFLRVVLDDPRGELVVRQGLAHIVLKDAGAPRSAFAYRTFWIIVHGITCWLVGRRVPLRGVDFRCATPPHDADYRLFFGAPVCFDKPESRLTLDAEFLRLPTIRGERALKEFLRRSPATILVRYRHDSGLAAKIRKRLGETFPVDWPDFDGLASQLRIPASTLRRRLRVEGLSYRDLKEEIRCGLAMESLLRSKRDVGRISTDLGYSEPSAFHRAFRKWTGKSPGAFRRGQS